MGKRIYAIGCAAQDCIREIEFGGCDKRTLRDMFGSDKLVATAYVAVQTGWQMDMQPDGCAFMFCPDHRND